MKARALPSRLLAALLLLLAAARATPAQAPSVEAVQADVLSRVLLFVRWPAGNAVPSRELNLCAVGDSPLQRALAALDNLNVNEHRLKVRKVASDQTADCQVVYLAGAEVRHLDALRGKPVLTVTDTQGQLERGAMLSLQLDGTRVGFDIGLGAARAAGIEFSAKLLKLARYVRDE